MNRRLNFLIFVVCYEGNKIFCDVGGICVRRTKFVRKRMEENRLKCLDIVKKKYKMGIFRTHICFLCTIESTFTNFKTLICFVCIIESTFTNFKTLKCFVCTIQSTFTNFRRLYALCAQSNPIHIHKFFLTLCVLLSQ